MTSTWMRGGAGMAATMMALAATVGLDSVPLAAQTHADQEFTVDLRQSGGRLIVPVDAPDGSTLEFMVSTANNVTILSESIGERFGTDAAFRMGGLQLDMNHAQTVPDSNLKTEGADVAGIVSANTLAEFDMLVDLPRERLVLRPVGRSAEWDGVALSDPVRLRIMHGVIIALDVELNGIAYPATLDLGTPTVIVNERAGAEARVDEESGVSLRLGSSVMEDVPVRVEELAIFSRWSPNGDGFVMVGAPITDGCPVAISWARREMRTCVK